MSDWTPETQPSGSLEPPRRFPPTAVGAMTPPPPERDPFHAYAVARMQAAPALIRAMRPALRGLRHTVRAIERAVARLH